MISITLSSPETCFIRLFMMIFQIIMESDRKSQNMLKENNSWTVPVFNTVIKSLQTCITPATNVTDIAMPSLKWSKFWSATGDMVVVLVWLTWVEFNSLKSLVIVVSLEYWSYPLSTTAPTIKLVTANVPEI